MPAPGTCGDPISVSEPGARYGRTTVWTERPGRPSPTTTRGHARTAGARMVLRGICDVEQRLCFALALWNGADPILKERIFGLTGNEGNHGEDAKEYWWYLDAVPSHAWLSWRYHYPQRAFPYARLVNENRRRSKLEAEFELLDSDAFDDARYWIVEVDYAKADPHDLRIRIRLTNAGPRARDRARAAHTVVSQHVVVGAGRGQAAAGRRRAGLDRRRARGLRPDGPAGRARRPTARSRRSCTARTKPTRSGCSAALRPRPTRRTESTTT